MDILDRTGREAQEDHAGRRWLPLPEDKVAIVFVKGQDDAIFSGCEFQDLPVRCSPADQGRGGDLNALGGQRLHDLKRYVLVREEAQPVQGRL